MTRYLLAVSIALFAAILPAQIQAAQGDSRMGLFVGNHSFRAGEDYTTGVAFGLSYGYEFYKDLLWMLSLTSASTSGLKEVDDEKFELEASSSIVKSGIRAYFNRESGNKVIYYIEGGISAMSYNIDYTYPGCEVCKTAGTGPGAYAGTGLEVRMTKNSTFIPQFNLQGHRITKENGEKLNVTSTSLLISLRISG